MPRAVLRGRPQTAAALVRLSRSRLAGGRGAQHAHARHSPGARPPTTQWSMRGVSRSGAP
eukprot:4264373-Prymnesium_polylepis.1